MPDGFKTIADLKVVVDAETEQFTNGLNQARDIVTRFAGEGSTALGLFDGAVNRLAPGILNLRNGIGALSPALDQIKASVDKTLTALEPFFKQIGAEEEFNALKASVNDLFEMFNTVLPRGFTTAQNSINAFLATLGLIEEKADKVKQKTDNIVVAALNKLAAAVDEGSGRMRLLTGATDDELPKQIEYLEKLIPRLNARLAELTKANGAAVTSFEGLTTKAKEAARQLMDPVEFGMAMNIQYYIDQLDALKRRLAEIGPGQSEMPDDDAFVKVLRQRARAIEDMRLKMSDLDDADQKREMRQRELSRMMKDSEDKDGNQRLKPSPGQISEYDQLAAKEQALNRELELRKRLTKELADAEREQKQIDRIIEGGDREIVNLHAKIAAVGGVTAATAAQQFEERALQQVQAAGLTLSDEEIALLHRKAEEIGRLTEQMQVFQRNMKLIEEVGTAVTRNLETQFRNWTNGTKLDVRAMTDSILKDLAMIAFKMAVTQPLQQLLQGIGGQLLGPSGLPSSQVSQASLGGISQLPSVQTSIPGLSGLLASGGEAEAGRAYLIGEEGPELFVPRGAGTVLGSNRVNGAIGGASPNVVLNISAPAGTTARETGRSTDAGGGLRLDVLIEQIEAGIAGRVADGSGSLGTAMQATYGLDRAAGGSLMTVAYPADFLPPAQLAGYGLTIESAAIRTPMDVGRARQRQRFGERLQKMTVKWIMTGDQLGVFKAWYTHQAKAGAAFFTMALTLDDGVADQDCRFVGSVSYNLIARSMWLVSATLEVKDPGVYSAEALDLLLSIGGREALVALADAATPPPSLLPAFTAWHVGFAAP